MSMSIPSGVLELVINIQIQIVQLESQILEKNTQIESLSNPPHTATMPGWTGMTPALSSPPESNASPFSLPFQMDPTFGIDANTYELISLGIEEPFPPESTVLELEKIYFAKVHHKVPMIHPGRYQASQLLPAHRRPPVCLRYSILATAALVSKDYQEMAETFYLRARKYAEIDEIKGLGEAALTVGHVQCWHLIITYENHTMAFSRSSRSAARAIKLSQMTGLHCLDKSSTTANTVLQDPQDWIELEERRRVFWVGFQADRYTSLCTGLPMSINEADVSTLLPASEEAFENGVPEQTLSLSAASSGDGTSNIHCFAAMCVLASILGENVLHMHRPTPQDYPNDPVNGQFWKRHYAMEKKLLNMIQNIPSHLTLPGNLRDPEIVFFNLTLHAAIINWHQAAISKAREFNFRPDIIQNSLKQCEQSARSIVSIMRMIGPSLVSEVCKVTLDFLEILTVSS
jgi:hypothetical protein